MGYLIDRLLTELLLSDIQLRLCLTIAAQYISEQESKLLTRCNWT